MHPTLKRIGSHVPFALPVFRAMVATAALPGYLRDFLKFRSLAGKTTQRFSVNWRDRYPCLTDRTLTTGFDRHYVYHTAWAARKVAEFKPELHIDISSSLYFSTLVSAFVPVKFYDYRPAELNLSNLSSGRADLYQLPFGDQSVKSLSCMHVVEHVGLGRYGDPLDPDGDLKACAQLKRVLAADGMLLFVTPVGRPRIQYNAHRIYAYRQIIQAFDGLTLKEFSLVPDKADAGGLMLNATEAQSDAQEYGCGCFWFSR